MSVMMRLLSDDVIMDQTVKQLEKEFKENPASKNEFLKLVNEHMNSILDIMQDSVNHA